MSNLSQRLVDWAQNCEMIDQYYTLHGEDCIKAADLLVLLIEVARAVAQEHPGVACHGANCRVCAALAKVMEEVTDDVR